MVGHKTLEGDGWDPVRRLIAYVDDEISEIRRRRGLEYLRPRYTRPLLLLDQHGAQTIRSLAELAGVSHSAMSQSVTAMRADDLVKSETGPDARTRLVSLTRLGAATIPFLRAESVARREVVRQLEAEASHPLARAVDATMETLDDRSFADRLEAQMHGSAGESVDRSSGR